MVTGTYARGADYMHEGRIFTMDPEYFPTPRMREIIDYLHNHNQHYSEY
jgi:alpha-glucosidase